MIKKCQIKANELLSQWQNRSERKQCSTRSAFLFIQTI